MKNTRRSYLMWLVTKALEGDDEAKLTLFAIAMPEHIRMRRGAYALASFVSANPKLEKQAWDIFRGV